MSKDNRKARDIVVRISNECGGAGLYAALMTWIDAYADHITDGHADSMRPGQVGIVTAETGAFTDPRTDDDMPDDVAWAAALIEARCKRDRDWFDELIRRLPDDGAEVGRYVARVLYTCADTINGLPRGLSRMGQGIGADEDGHH
jgi:hypothetical protein